MSLEEVMQLIDLFSHGCKNNSVSFVSTHEGKKDRIDKSNANTAVWVGFLVLPKHEVKMPQT